MEGRAAAEPEPEPEPEPGAPRTTGAGAMVSATGSAVAGAPVLSATAAEGAAGGAAEAPAKAREECLQTDTCDSCGQVVLWCKCDLSTVSKRPAAGEGMAGGAASPRPPELQGAAAAAQMAAAQAAAMMGSMESWLWGGAGGGEPVADLRRTDSVASLVGQELGSVGDFTAEREISPLVELGRGRRDSFPSPEARRAAPGD